MKIEWNREPEDWGRYARNRGQELLLTGRISISVLANLLGIFSC